MYSTGDMPNSYSPLYHEIRLSMSSKSIEFRQAFFSSQETCYFNKSFKTHKKKFFFHFNYHYVNH